LKQLLDFLYIMIIGNLRRKRLHYTFYFVHESFENLFLVNANHL